jgi:uncharacterized repeat protein (TIGR03803 family)
LVRDTAGNLYGTTYLEGAFKAGVIFKVDASGNETILHTFDKFDGWGGSGNLIADEAGNLYGLANGGGSYGYGVVFEVDANGGFGVLHSFSGGTGGSFPYGGLIRDASGNLYGTTSDGGTFAGGTAFKLTS